MKILSDEAIKEVANKAFREDGLLQHYVESRGHWERLAPFIAQAEQKNTLEQVVEWGEELCDCPKRELPTDHEPTKRKKCWKCWLELPKQSLQAEEEE